MIGPEIPTVSENRSHRIIAILIIVSAITKRGHATIDHRLDWSLESPRTSLPRTNSMCESFIVERLVTNIIIGPCSTPSEIVVCVVQSFVTPYLI